MIGAGQLRKRIAIEQPIYTEGTNGEKIISWKHWLDVHAGVQPLSSKEITVARAAALQTTHNVKIRYVQGLTSAHRLTWSEPDGRKRILNISDITDWNERHIEMILKCSEVS